jgi:transposase
MEDKNPEDFIFIDESGTDTTVSTEYARTEGGDRIKAPKPSGTWDRFSIIGAISILGIVAVMYGKWATDACIFISFIKDCLLKSLKKGQIVFLDNAKFHKNSRIKELIESVGAKLVFLPPYSPDLSPIEKMWSKIKHYIKKKAPRNAGEFHNALNYALSELEDDDFEEWYDACGYQLL